MIDLGAVGEPVSAPDSGPAPSPNRRFPRIHNAALAYAAVAIALAAAVVTIVKWSPLHRPLAESTVLGYLEAVHDGDVEAALAFTDQEDAEGVFLVPEALDSRWEISEVVQVEYGEIANGKALAKVYAEIEAHDGTRVGARYAVVVERGDAKILGALVQTEAWGTLDYLDLNGVRKEIDLTGDPQYTMLLPGYYEFYPELPSILEFEGESAMLVLGNQYKSLGAEYSDSWMPSPWLVVSDEGEAQVDAAVQRFYDDCAVEPERTGCPFAFPEDDDRELALAPGEHWEIIAYPQVDADRLWYEHGIGFGLESAQAGEARARVEIAEDGETHTALVSCPLWVTGLYATVDLERGFSIDTEYSGMFDEHCRSIVEVEE